MKATYDPAMNDTNPNGHAAADDRVTVIGIAGGVGSGKSTVSSMLRKLGCLVLDADAQAKALLDEPGVQEEIVSWWGDAVLGEDGLIDRAAVARIVFQDDDELQRLESLIHPRVIRMQRDAIRGADPAKIPAVVLDVPLLFEADMDESCDAVIFVDTPEEARLLRVMTTRGWDEDELERRQSNQWPLEAKIAGSDFVVNNTGDLADLEKQVGEVFEQIRQAQRS